MTAPDQPLQPTPSSSPSPQLPTPAPTPPANVPLEVNITQFPEPIAKKKGCHDWVDTLSKVTLMFASVAGGLWALNSYRETTAPTLEPKTQITSSLSWPHHLQTDDSCWAEYSVTVKNNGATPFDIDWYEAKAWLIDRKSVTPTLDKKPNSFTPPPMDNTSDVYHQSACEKTDSVCKLGSDQIIQDLGGHYPAGNESKSSGEFVFKKPKLPTNADSIIVLRIDIHGRSEKAGFLFGTGYGPLDDHTWTFDQLCPPKEKDDKD
jgi:hypothetical protein